MNTILALGIISITSIIVAKLINKLKLPAVTGYLLAGLLIGPYVLNIISETNVKDLSFISDFALGLIAFHVGKGFQIKQIKKLAKSVITITFLQAFITVIVVFVTLLAFTKDMPFSLVIAAISAATAPAATIMVIKEYRARGTLTDTLISVVAMDDLVCIILFSIANAIAEIALSGSITIVKAIASPLIEIIGSFLVGGIAGLLINFAVNRKSKQESIILIPMSIILLSIGISIKFELSSLLTCVTAGAMIANLSPIEAKIFDTAEDLSTHIYLLFFTFSGMSLDLNVIKGLGFIGIIYIIARTLGKISGAYIGTLVTKAESKIKKNLGFGLLPQAGVAIGLAAIAATKFPTMGNKILNLIMASVFVYEFVGPVLTKYILIKSGEAQEH
ncbi:cation:proton antiporter [Sedimentibacter sp. zth1]|uniref:cation:proton antiporter n=1 Tax=Sedimentibacter sp. zth1 TaxID=2816908 RepID=UPI001A9142CA|nr:cation:proton antiporter [Sedimentibacter sp. zth1]QSX06192.1 cation:proton antiporter [Sedimentibacter sp. zth1]